jgi:hypothetical protein
MDRQELEGLSRDALIEIADRIGVTRPRVLTHSELVDEILTRTIKGERERAKARGWLGRARDLVARVIEKGLHLPETARALGMGVTRGLPVPPPPLPTVTLAEIYAAQGHLERAIAVLDEVLVREPDHKDAAQFRERFVAQRLGRSRSRATREPQEKVEREPALADLAERDSTATKAAKPTSSDETAASAASVGGAGTAHPAGASDRELPPYYEVDEVVAIGVDPHSIYLYWEVRPTTLERMRERTPSGHLALRVVSVRPSWDGPEVRTRDVTVEPAYGDLSVRDLAPGSIVRVSLGWAAGDTFQPIAIANEVTTARAARAARTILPEVTRWHDADAAVEPSAASGAPSVPREWPVGADSAGGNSRHNAPAGLDDGVDELEEIVTQRATRWPRGGASELAWEELNEEERALRRARQRASELVRGGASELARGGASELMRDYR